MTSSAEKEADPKIVYADIIDLPAWEPKNHERMSLYNRAAQFASYKALSGYEDMVAEEIRSVEAKIEPEEAAVEVLNRKLAILSERTEAGETPEVTIVYFLPDPLKPPGGRYEAVTEKIKRIDPTAGQIILQRRRRSGLNETIRIDDVLEIHSELLDAVEE